MRKGVRTPPSLMAARVDMVREAKKAPLGKAPRAGSEQGLRPDEAGGTCVHLPHRDLPFDELGFKRVTKTSPSLVHLGGPSPRAGVFITMGRSADPHPWFAHRKDRIRRKKNEESNRSKEGAHELNRQDNLPEVREYHIFLKFLILLVAGAVRRHGPVYLRPRRHHQPVRHLSPGGSGYPLTS